MLQFLRLALQGLLNSFEGLMVWLLRPRIILLLFIALLLGAGTYLAYEYPAIGVAAKKFVTKTIPQWYEATVLVVAKFWPKITAWVTQGIYKRYGKLLSILILVPLLPKVWRKEIISFKGRLVEVLVIHLYEHPKAWWHNLSKFRRRLTFVALIAIIAAVPSLHFLGWLFFPLAAAWQLLAFVSKWVIAKLGARAIVDTVNARTIGLLARFMPTGYLIRAKWRYLKGMVVRRRRIRARSKELVSKGKEAWQHRKEAKQQKEIESSITITPDEAE